MPALPCAPGDKRVLVADLETYPNWFCVAISDGEKRKCFASHRPGEIHKLAAALKDKSLAVAGFNNFAYDDIILRAICTNPDITPAKVRALSNRIIDPQDHEEEQANFQARYTDTPWGYSIDVFQLLNGKGSLKEHACRSHAQDVGETPYHFGEELPAVGYEAVERYCVMDVVNTEQKLRHLWKLVEMRATLDVTFGLGARVYCLSEQGIAQATFLKLHRDRTGSYAAQIREACKDNPDNKQGVWAVSHIVSTKVQYHTTPFKAMFKALMAGELIALDHNLAKWELRCPALPITLQVPLAGHSFQLGVGGLHSIDKPGIFRSTATEKIIDLDVTSYYPSIIINDRLHPKHLGPSFAEDMRTLRDRRVEAKRAGNKAVANALKIVVNATFGKLNDVWSPLRSVPDAMRVTLNGQLYLLMLIEQLHVVGAEILSANTDGVTIRWAGDESALKLAIKAWENATGFELERTDYTVYARRDVNCYAAASADGVKVKGAFFLLPGQGGALKIKEGPDAGKGDGLIIKRAALEYLINGTPICKTVRTCKPEELIFYQRCKNGGSLYYGGDPIGRLARWYVAVDGMPLKRQNPNGSFATLPHGRSAALLMNLDDIGCDIDFTYYEKQAEALVASCTL